MTSRLPMHEHGVPFHWLGSTFALFVLFVSLMSTVHTESLTSKEARGQRLTVRMATSRLRGRNSGYWQSSKKWVRSQREKREEKVIRVWA